MNLSACLIVKNESSCLDKCLSSLKGFDEIVVVLQS
jgi:glycosyltransferase involved in cell wall biosynthesis